jgi:hypothetical protein
MSAAGNYLCTAALQHRMTSLSRPKAPKTPVIADFAKIYYNMPRARASHGVARYLAPLPRLAGTVRNRLVAMAEVIEIHVVCRDREGVTRESADSFVSGDWEIASHHLRPGVLFALHQIKTRASYLHGHIRDCGPADDGRFIVTVGRSPTPLPWRGSGSGEIGFQWGGADWSHIPPIPIVIRNLRPGENHALRNLNEADPAGFRYPRIGTFLASGRAESNRQATFNTYLLRIALALDGHTVPYAFRDDASQPYRLDDGAIGIAIQQGVVDEPRGDLNGRARTVTINQAHWRSQESSGLLEMLRRQNLDQDGVGRDLFEEFDPTAVSVGSVRRAVATTREARIGQPEFRRRLLQAYDGRCAVTGSAIAEALEAAHIIPDSLVGAHGMDPRNGLLLRADLHRLFDCGLIGFRMDGDQVRMVIAPILEGSGYHELASQPVRLPLDPMLRPRGRCIERRWEALCVG